MLKREFGPARVPVIGQGTWRLRGPEAVDALRTGIELGLTHIDTAELYGTEEMVAEAIEGRRDEIFLVSKVLPSNATRKGTVRACEQSLQRLRTDRLDCYLARPAPAGRHHRRVRGAAGRGQDPQLRRQQLRRGAVR